MRSTKGPKSETFFSPAKLNLFFRIIRKREDGYHETASLMQAVSLCDILHFTKGKRDRLTCSDPFLACDDSNHIRKALTLFRKQTGLTTPMEIHLDKRIPIQGGLGGGSSNLATTLWALNRLHDHPLLEEELMRLAGEVSSDAPFFFSHGTAYVTGRGGKVENLSPLHSKKIYLAILTEGVSTPLAYKYCRPHACSEECPRELLHSFYESGWRCVNDLEFPVFKLKPNLRNVKENLESLGFEKVLMTGSGSTFFCVGEILSPYLPNIRFQEISFLFRPEDEWYGLEGSVDDKYF
jgi:4-diphosphocytidyl-2-C-methyl-D-erythritol kinase